MTRPTLARLLGLLSSHRRWIAAGSALGFLAIAANVTLVATSAYLVSKAAVVTTLKDPAGKPINGFEGLAIDGGICAAKGFGQAVAVDAPALDGWGLGLLVMGLATAALLVLRR